MKNHDLIEQTKQKICSELKSAGFKQYGDREFNADEIKSMKEFVEDLVYDAHVYAYLESKQLIHVDYCLLCGTSFNEEEPYKYTFFGRSYNMCSDCYETKVPAHKKQKRKFGGCFTTILFIIILSLLIYSFF